MIRTINIVHRNDCVTDGRMHDLRPLARVNEVSEDNRQSSMRDQVLGKLTEGMRVRIRIREGARAPIFKLSSALLKRSV